MNTTRYATVSSLILALMAVGSAAEVPPQTPLRATDGPVVALWQKNPSPNKPYIAQLFAPGDKPVPLLDDSPSDHFHHHGLMFALNVDDTDFWAEKDIRNAGRQEVVASAAALDRDGFQNLRWLATDGTPLLDEARRVRVKIEGMGADAVHWLDWETALTPAAGRESVRLSGEHYFGLGMRFLPAWADHGEFIWADAATPPAVTNEKVSPGDWCAVRNTIEGRPVTVLMVAHPSNPRPGEWFTMSRPFCYLSATLNLKKEPLTLARNQAWTLRYGLAVLSTPADPARLANLAAAWRKSNSPDATKLPSQTKP
jgi:Methane oxygenase PmoA